MYNVTITKNYAIIYETETLQTVVGRQTMPDAMESYLDNLEMIKAMDVDADVSLQLIDTNTGEVHAYYTSEMFGKAKDVREWTSSEFALEALGIFLASLMDEEDEWDGNPYDFD